ncbi:MAG TPA: PfaD family polyunsaturated fatty acid/polyketide biosynthesis protein [Anaerolineales bacterium]|nr:PfaD family polyunsaturated fatty acid/polyketide biosynthesis protein [Anaerolineales bacterium]
MNEQNISGIVTGMLNRNFWQGEASKAAFEPDKIKDILLDANEPIWLITSGTKTGVASGGEVVASEKAQETGYPVIGQLPQIDSTTLGHATFKQAYGTPYAYYTGAMANGIASEKLVITAGKAGFLASFGAAGLGPERVQSAIKQIQEALPGGLYAFNLINSPSDPAAEARSADLYVKNSVRTVEASAYVDLTVPLVYYRVAGLAQNPDGSVQINNRVIAKLSRREVANLFLHSAPEDILARLIEEGKITHQQADLARRVPMADDITVEADSGGHTDNRPLVCLIPGVVALRDEIQEKFGYSNVVRIGAGGGISTPEAALAAFMMGAAYVVTGSVNQACVEAGTSEHTRKLLAQAGMADIAMAPASDMFEMGVRVQVLKRGTLFPMRAQRLWEIYDAYPRWEDVPQPEREKLERTIFKQDFDTIWQGTEAFFQDRDPRQVERANRDPHHKMALVFRWYLGLSSRWSNSGETGREMDYQIWCGPAMGAFNDWVRGSYLEDPANRSVVDVAMNILNGAAYLTRVRMAELIGLHHGASLQSYRPRKIS